MTLEEQEKELLEHIRVAFENHPALRKRFNDEVPYVLAGYTKTFPKLNTIGICMAIFSLS